MPAERKGSPMPATKKSARKRAQSKNANASVRSQPLIAVRDVPASSRWYAQLLGAERTSESMHLVNAKEARPGHGVLLWFEVDDFDAAVKRVRALRAKVLLKPHVNPAPGHREVWIRDPDGYVVVLASPDGEASQR
jgi:catechol 2,3-dioxygenase-like lactoylglutathione lyase family enzyme